MTVDNLMRDLFVRTTASAEASSDFEDSDSRHSIPIQKPHRYSSRSESGVKGRSKSVFYRLFGAKGGREEAVSAGTGAGNSEKSIDISPMISCRGDQRVSGVIHNLLYAIETIDEWEDARCAELASSQQRAKGVQRWLVRLHNVSMCSKRLPELTSRLLSEVEKRVAHRCPRNKEVMQHLFSLQKRSLNRDKNTLSEVREALEKRLREYQEEELEELRVLVNDTTQRLTEKLQQAGREICRYKKYRSRRGSMTSAWQVVYFPHQYVSLFFSDWRLLILSTTSSKLICLGGCTLVKMDFTHRQWRSLFRRFRT